MCPLTENLVSLSQKLSVAKSSSAKSETQAYYLPPHLDFVRRELRQVLCVATINVDSYV